MSFKAKDLLNAAGDLLPGFNLVKLIVEGAGALLLKKAAKGVGIDEKQIDAVLQEAGRIASTDEEFQKALLADESSRRQFDLAYYGSAAEVSAGSRFWRNVTRPLISLAMVGLFILGVLIRYGEQLFGGMAADQLLTVPSEVVELTKWTVAFWFTSRGVEKIAGLSK
ncbi:MAG: hypothetical protein NTW14_14840 [bacterium]|nr:hypothetical protein [bacterium]